MSEKKVPVEDSKIPDLTGKRVDDIFPGIFPKRCKDPWDAPCPEPLTDDISKDHGINTWVFNHLPLTAEQKESFLKILIEDQKAKEPSKPKPKQFGRVRVLRRRVKDSVGDGRKLSIKEATK